MDRIEWHQGFQAGIELRFRRYKKGLTFYHELPLTKQPMKIDTLVIVKDDSTVIQEDVAAIFRRHNVIEYKSPDDDMSIDSFYNVLSYMARYKANTGKTNAVKADEVTGTLMRQRRPEEMFREIERLGGQVHRHCPGVYYIRGLVHMPMQVWVQPELPGPENAVLRILTRIARADDIKRFVGESLGFSDRDDKDNADAVFEVSVSANTALYEDLERSDPAMCNAMMELMKEQIQKSNEKACMEAHAKGHAIGRVEGLAEGLAEGRAVGIAEGIARAIIPLVKDHVLSIEEGAKRMNISVTELESIMAE